MPSVLSWGDMKQATTALLSILVLSACATKPHVQVTPVAVQDATQVCIIENPSVKFNFLQVYRKALQDAGYTVDVIPPMSSLGSCPVTTKYIAFWSLDLVILYLHAAQLDVYKDGRPAGRARYEARHGALSSSVNAEDTIRDLVKQLFTK